MQSTTETVIREQFPYWSRALVQPVPEVSAEVVVITGCGTSYYLAQSLAAAFNHHGKRAMAVPGAEWVQRPGDWLGGGEAALVIGLSRSGTTTETVQAIEASRRRGWPTLAVSCEDDTAILRAAERALYIPTHPEEGIVMSVSASLMLLAGLRMAGAGLPGNLVSAAEGAMRGIDRGADAVIAGRSHFVFLGGGSQYGIAAEGALKLAEMSLSFGQSFYPLEYRHGPVSLITEGSLVVMLYSDDTAAEEAKVVAEVQALGARVIGFDGPGDLRIDTGISGAARGLACLPALQLLGEKVALRKGINTTRPRNLTKVVVLN